MATNSNNARKKQKITEVVENCDDSLLPTPAVRVVVVPALSFGNIVKGFPDFLLCCVLPYIADRVIWNSIASSNKDIYEKSKAMQPPWPLCYKLPPGVLSSWSPCGTRIACSCSHHSSNIVIIDQRLGPLRNNGNSNNNNRPGWEAHGGGLITNLKYSPNGRFLVSTGHDKFIRLWDNTRNYVQLQEWNMREEIAEEVSIHLWPFFSVSTCSKYIAVSLGKWTYLKDVEGKTIKSLLLPFAQNETLDRQNINNIMASSNGRTIFICYNGIIQVWRTYLDEDDEDRLITLCRQTDLGRFAEAVRFSHDNSMVAICDVFNDKGTLWSINKDHKRLTKKFDFQGSACHYFTPDSKYIVFNEENGPTLWSIAEGKITNNELHLLDSCGYTKRNLVVECFSRINRQCIVRDRGDRGAGNRYITSYSVK